MRKQVKLDGPITIAFLRVIILRLYFFASGALSRAYFPRYSSAEALTVFALRFLFSGNTELALRRQYSPAIQHLLCKLLLSGNEELALRIRNFRQCNTCSAINYRPAIQHLLCELLVTL